MRNSDRFSPGYPQGYANGSGFDMGVLFGEIRSETRRQSEILIAVLEAQNDLREAMWQMPERIAASFAARTPPPLPAPPRQSALQQWTELFQAAQPLAKILLVLAALGAVVAAKVAYPDLLPVLRHAIGLS